MILGDRITLVAAGLTLLFLLFVFDLVRRGKLSERYALLWLITGLVVFLLSLWKGGLDFVAGALGIAYPPTAIFLAAALFFLFVLLQISTVISRHSREVTRLLQEVALMREELERQDRANRSSEESPQ